MRCVDGEMMECVSHDRYCDCGSIVSKSRIIFLSRPCDCCRGGNVEKRYYDVFHSNQNGEAVIKAIDVERWVVFGSSFDFCLKVTAEGLAKLGENVVIIEDATLPSPQSTDESMKQTREYLSSLGVKWMQSSEFFKMIKARQVE